jgi:hypothetical protein
MSSTYKSLRILRMPNGKYRLCFFEGERFVQYHHGSDMDTREQAVRRKSNYENTYGMKQ